MKTPKVTGLEPTGIVAVTVFVAVAMADTVLLRVLTTKTLLPSGVMATPEASIPTGTAAITVFVEASMTDTVAEAGSKASVDVPSASGLCDGRRTANPTFSAAVAQSPLGCHARSCGRQYRLVGHDWL